MSFRINTNVNAMNALRNLSSTGMELNKATTRLATGLRINSGADDPSGLIASESYRAQLSSMDQALRNNEDATNFAKTAEGGLDEVNRLLRDARSLAIANGNGTLDETQKQANQSQLTSILSSIDRIAGNTAFGSKKLLNGAAGTTNTVIKSNVIDSASFSGEIGTSGVVGAADNIDVDVTQAATQATRTSTNALAATLATAADFSINGTSFNMAAGTARQDVVDAINAKAGETGVTATLNGTNNVVFSTDEYGSDAKLTIVDSGGTFEAANFAQTFTGVDAEATVTYNDGTTDHAGTFDQGKGLQLKDNKGNVINLNAAGNTVTNHTVAIRLESSAASFQIGANAGQTARLSLGNFSSSSLGFTASNSDITGSDSSTALAAIDTAIASVADARGKIGTFMKNTIESNVRSLGVARENLAATESSIREIDVAQEMTNYTKLQILQQSGLSVLAQANSGPQAVLSLLR